MEAEIRSPITKVNTASLISVFIPSNYVCWKLGMPILHRLSWILFYSKLSGQIKNFPIWDMWYSNYFTMRIEDFTMIRLEIFKNKTTIFYKSLFFSTKKWKLCNGVVSTWKSKVSAFQNIKNLWNRFIIHEDILIFVLRSIIIICERVYPLWSSMMRPHDCHEASS